jgi:hypothetical protein
MTTPSYTYKQIHSIKKNQFLFELEASKLAFMIYFQSLHFRNLNVNAMPGKTAIMRYTWHINLLAKGYKVGIPCCISMQILQG